MIIYELGFYRHSDDCGILGLFLRVDLLRQAYQGLHEGVRQDSYISERVVDCISSSREWDVADYQLYGIEQWPSAE
jgi:hypothetical protein